jgi:hypothetical protein
MAVAVTLAGCLGADDEPRPAQGAPREIAEVVQELERATAAGDFATVCDELFTAAARERAGGDDCERLTRSAAEDVKRPRIDVRSISVERDRALVRVVTRADGQARAADALELRREGGEWRVEALAD